MILLATVYRHEKNGIELMSMNKAVFLDRDGVINIEKNYLYRIEDFEFSEGVFETLRYFQRLAYLLIIITNQAGIGRGYYSEEDFRVLNQWMLQEFAEHGVTIAQVLYSPDHPESGLGKYKKESYDRKPNPGMILKARDEFKIDLQKSLLIGDQESDIEAGINAGVRWNILVSNGRQVHLADTKADFVIKTLLELAKSSCESTRNFSEYIEYLIINK